MVIRWESSWEEERATRNHPGPDIGAEEYTGDSVSKVVGRKRRMKTMMKKRTVMTDAVCDEGASSYKEGGEVTRGCRRRRGDRGGWGNLKVGPMIPFLYGRNARSLELCGAALWPHQGY